MKGEAKKRAEQLVRVYGYKTAMLFCVEMNIEYTMFPNNERSDFYTEVTRQVKKLGL